jgi:hypothetical protein
MIVGDRYATVGRDELIARLEAVDAAVVAIRTRAEACRNTAGMHRRAAIECAANRPDTALVDCAGECVAAAASTHAALAYEVALALIEGRRL